MMNIANYMCLRLQNDGTALNRTLDCPIHNYTVSCNDPVDMCPAGDDEGSTV